jgi:hypothetical protein
MRRQIAALSEKIRNRERKLEEDVVRGRAELHVGIEKGRVLFEGRGVSDKCQHSRVKSMRNAVCW